MANQTSPPEFQDKRPRPSWMPRIESMDASCAYDNPDTIPASGDGKVYPQQAKTRQEATKQSNSQTGDIL